MRKATVKGLETKVKHLEEQIQETQALLYRLAEKVQDGDETVKSACNILETVMKHLGYFKDDARA